MPPGRCGATSSTTCSSRRHGLEFVRPRGQRHRARRRMARALTIYEDPGRTAEGLARVVAARRRGVAAIRRVARGAGARHRHAVHRRRRRRSTIPADAICGRCCARCARFARSSKADAYRLLRWGPMAVADLVGECFETEQLRAAVAADGIFGTRFGPWSAGSGLVLLLRAANEAVDRRALVVRARRTRRDRHGARTRVQSGRRRDPDRAPRRVRSSCATSGRAASCSRTAPRSPHARSSRRSIRSRRFSQLCDPIDLAPEFLWRMRNYRAHGTRRQDQSRAVGACRRSRVSMRRADRAHAHRARDSTISSARSIIPSTDAIRPSRTSSSRSHRCSTRRWRPTARTSCPPTCSSRRTRLRDGTWDDQRDRFARAAIDTIERHAPGLRSLIVGAAGDHAARPRTHLRLHRRPHLPWRAGARPDAHNAAAARLGPVPDASQRPVPVQFRHASRHRSHRRIGRERRARNPARAALKPVGGARWRVASPQSPVPSPQSPVSGHRSLVSSCWALRR